MRVFRRLCCLLLVVCAAVTGPAPQARASAWGWPLPPPHQVVRGFAPPAHDWLAGHRGVDLAARAGEPVLATGAGRISFAGTIGGIGVVALRHPDGLETTYEPVRARVHVGDAVALGATIGQVSPTGHCSSRTCLHWGLRRRGTYLDPLQLVGASRVRLLPVRTASAGWLLPAASGASIGSSAVVLGWAVHTQRRRRRRLPAGVTDLSAIRNRRRSRADPAAS